MNDIIEDAMELIGPGRICEVNAENVFLLVNALKILTEQHEAFRQEVSDAVVDYVGYVPLDSPAHPITRFIITKPDPLVETLKDMRSDPTPYINSEIYAERLRAALAKRGLEIREKSE